MKAFRIVEHGDAAAFLERATEWLLRDEAAHNLLLGIAGRLRDGHNPYDDPISLITVEEGDEVVGCAWRTPPFNLGLTAMPPAALPALVEAVGRLHPALPGILGPPEVVREAARLWAAPRGLALRDDMALRIYALTDVTPPASPSPGRFRPAAPGDVPRLADWAGAFQVETSPGDAPRPDLTGAVERLVAQDVLWVWEDGEAVSMAAAVSPTPHGVRVNFVYSPPERRGRGYASACVAALSQAQLDAGRQFCFLYTDLANPTSNAIYQRIGYRPVTDALQLGFASGPVDVPGAGR